MDFNSLPTLTPPSAIVLGPVEEKNIDDAMPDFSLTPPQLNSSPTFGRPIVLSPRPRLISSPERHDSQASTSSHGNMIQLEQQPIVQKQGEQLNELDVFGDDLDVHGRAEMSRNVTTKKYDHEFNLFVDWVDKHGKKWGVTSQDILTSSLTSSGLDYLLAEYISNRYNMTVHRREGIIVRLDPNTIRPTVSRLCSVIERQTDYR